MGSVTSSRPWLGYFPGQEEPVLVEFDWNSLRRDEEIEARADQSLRKLNAKLRARNLRRHLMPALGVLLAPVAALMLLRFVRAAWA